MQTISAEFIWHVKMEIALQFPVSLVKPTET